MQFNPIQMSKGEPISSEDALRIAKRHMLGIALLDTTEKIAIVGSLRRKKDMVSDIDYQVVCSGVKGMRAIEEYFWAKDWVCESVGDRRGIFKAPSGVYVNVFNTEIMSWGAALMHNTGPSKYNIRKRAMIKRMDMVLNQYGLYKRIYDDDNPDDYKLIASETEKDIYDALSWAYCKPEDRE